MAGQQRREGFEAPAQAGIFEPPVRPETPQAPTGNVMEPGEEKLVTVNLGDIMNELQVPEVDEIPPDVNADEIINEILGDPDAREIFRHNEDEGIDLDIFEELQGDIEPFDFEQEVEGYDW